MDGVGLLEKTGLAAALNRALEAEFIHYETGFDVSSRIAEEMRFVWRVMSDFAEAHILELHTQNQERIARGEAEQKLPKLPYIRIGQRELKGPRHFEQNIGFIRLRMDNRTWKERGEKWVRPVRLNVGTRFPNLKILYDNQNQTIIGFDQICVSGKPQEFEEKQIFQFSYNQFRRAPSKITQRIFDEIENWLLDHQPENFALVNAALQKAYAASNDDVSEPPKPPEQ